MSVVCAVLFALDQLTKHMIMNSIPLDTNIPVISGFFDLVNIRNRGAAFGFLNRSDMDWKIWLFSVATLASIAAVILLVRSWPKRHFWLYASLGLLLGGALGNWLDRLRFRAVVDFLDFHVAGWHWPAFNVADMGICCGAFAACFILWREPEDDTKKRKNS